MSGPDDTGEFGCVSVEPHIEVALRSSRLSVSIGRVTVRKNSARRTVGDNRSQHIAHLPQSVRSDTGRLKLRLVLLQRAPIT